MDAIGPIQNDRGEQFVAQFVRIEPTLHAFILSLVPHWTDAEEILQQTSLVLWRKFEDYQPGTSFLSWACQIARYEALNFRKKHRRDRHVFNDQLIELLAEETVQDSDRLQAERRALTQCLRKLKDKPRKLLQQCYDGGTTVKQLASEMGRSANSIYKMLDRIRQKLLDCVRRNLNVEGTL